MSGGIVTQWSQHATRPPFAIIGLFLLCLFFYVVYAGLSPLMQQALIDMGGMEPAVVSGLLAQPPSTWWSAPALSLLTALLLHDSWLHLLGNLVYLWVFGIKVEQRLGSLGMIAIFLAGGALANLIVALRLPELTSPIIGASGAVSAVIGAYLGLFPRRHIGLFIPLGLYLQFARVPALFVIGSWFTLQLLYTAFGPINAAVAWWTHLAGFALGISLALAARGIALLRHQAGPTTR
ncbi:MAG: rhomboid family intramembrane serine protease [Xanthomonadales bacterium]|nr:rhomboid family intramembrane serine protease [Gammaproteobacteria bacterium]MBT8052082.1 rhomboid family intramembrane serine protease [Gammaproteobacteria bacterium]MBT8055831.1 rhomboid family intramembrane serine protease [Gammaproteobacteria bacterium]NNJ80097.1 rhomboid family intramembrane serine protease [Xanthomonadales bacterium]NNL04502.1 rhomboid family intramembrane serine protease [Xanthomonadales bacterium]